MNTASKIHLLKDSSLIFGSIALAVFLLLNPVVDQILASTMQVDVLVSFLAGVFVTSVLTAPSAVVVFGELGGVMSPWLIAFVGAFGSVCGDLILFRFVRSHFTEDINVFVRSHTFKKLFSFSRFKTFRWLLPFIGGILIASPLPDELGVTLLGVTKLPTKFFMIISYFSNFVGILLIALIGQSLVS